MNSSGAKAAFQTVSQPLKTRMFPNIAGFLLSQAISLLTMRYRQKNDISEVINQSVAVR